MIANIWVRDKADGTVHQVGTDVHDSLIVHDGEVQYKNMQCGGGTPYDYEFVEQPDDLECYVEITPEQLLINRRLVHRDIVAALQNKREE